MVWSVALKNRKKYTFTTATKMNAKVLHPKHETDTFKTYHIADHFVECKYVRRPIHDHSKTGWILVM